MQTPETLPREQPEKGRQPPPGQESREPAGETPRSPSEAVLESGPVDSRKELGGGKNLTELIDIRDDGKGVWKPREVERAVAERGTGYRRERAAYLVSLFLGFDFVPPTVIREIEGKTGSLQEYIPQHRIGADLRYKQLPENAPQGSTLREQWLRLELFDYIIINMDRHEGNWLLDNAGRLWAIDHGFSFRRFDFDEEILRVVSQSVLAPETVLKIKELADSPNRKSLLKTLLGELLPLDEVDSVVKRLGWLAEAVSDGLLTPEAINSLNDKAMQDWKIRSAQQL